MAAFPFRDAVRRLPLERLPVRRVADTVRREVWLLAALVAVGLAAWIFAGLADEVTEGHTHRFDRAVLLLMRDAADPSEPWGPPWFREAVRDVTALGSVTIVSAITVIAVLFLALTRRAGAALLVFVSIAGGGLLSTVLKQFFERPRPDLVPRGMEVFTASFPSGHAILSATAYLTLGALLMRLEPRRRVKTFVMAVAIVATVLVGCSRIYLAVHWPTDVVAGWTVGAGWALACWCVAVWLQNRGAVEDETQPTAVPEATVAIGANSDAGFPAPD